VRHARRGGVAVMTALLLCACTTPASSPPPEDAVAAAVRAVAPRATYGIYDVADGRCTQVAGMGTSRILPIASVFKLWILHALAVEVAAGRARWTETFPVTDELRSDPSGEVYAMAAGTAVSLRRYAELMISISDNTAADHLLARLGRRSVEASMVALGVSTAATNTPLLSTADLTRLKFVSPRFGRRYLALRSVSERRRFLERLPHVVPFPWSRPGNGSQVPDLSTPRLIDRLEWFATARDVCATLAGLDRLAARPGQRAVGDILELNPGLPPDLLPSWESARFKGGSEPGVLALAWSLRRGDGARRVVVLAWSDPRHALSEGPVGEKALRAVLVRARS
jgi:hypothetical protein